MMVRMLRKLWERLRGTVRNESRDLEFQAEMKNTSGCDALQTIPLRQAGTVRRGRGHYGKARLCGRA
jgi:hypothetical protein